jgi:hypothetical protein
MNDDFLLEYLKHITEDELCFRYFYWYNLKEETTLLF